MRLLSSFLSRAVLVGGLLGCAAAAGAGTLVVVRDEAGAKVEGAEVYLNCVHRGVTDGAGEYLLSAAAAGDRVQVRKLVHAGTPAKGNHDGWAYHVWLTNIVMENDGTQRDHVVADPTATQGVVIRKDNAQIGLNLVASVEYNATPTNLAEISLGLQRASAYLFDVTDGQMFLEKVRIHEDKEQWDDADIRYDVTAWPHAHVVGPAGLGAGWAHMFLPGPGFDGGSATPGTWPSSAGFRTVVHELGHYGLGVWDEYVKAVPGGGTASTTCTLDRDGDPEGVRASAMAYHYNATEVCADWKHNPDTAHHQITGRSIWGSVASNWASGAGLWKLRTPMTRGVVNPGPTSLSCFSRVTPTIVEVTPSSCEPFRLKAKRPSGVAIVGAHVDLFHGSETVYQGQTDGAGNVPIYGAVPGDTLSLQGFGDSWSFCFWAGGLATVLECGDKEMVASPSCILIPVIPWPTLDLDDLLVAIEFPMEEQPFPIDVVMDQDGFGPRPVTLAYDHQKRAYVGRYQVDAARGLSFNASLKWSGGQGASTTTLRLSGARFDERGPDPQYPAEAWPLLVADGDVNVTVTGRSLPTGTGVLAGRTLLPGAVPQGWTLAGGPYVVTGARPLLEPVGLELRYRDGEQPAAANLSVHRHDGQRWVPLGTEVDPQARQARASIFEWGIYAVLARMP
jgi:hypothetical protein